VKNACTIYSQADLLSMNKLKKRGALELIAQKVMTIFNSEDFQSLLFRQIQIGP